MSKYHSNKTLYKDRECLVEALIAQGYQREVIEIHDEAQALIGYQGDVRQQRANVIVRRKHVGGAANDIGWQLLADGTYAQHISDYDSIKHNAEWQKGMKRAYTEGVGIKTARLNGFKFLGKKVENGKVQLQFLDVRA